jgi:hypothetical protein
MNPPVALEIKLDKRRNETFSDSNVASFASNQAKMSVAQGQVPLEVIAAEENLLNATRAYETLTMGGDEEVKEVGLVDLAQLQQIEAPQVIEAQRPYFVKSIIPNAIFIPKNHPWGQRLSRPNHAPYLGVQMYHDHPKYSTLVADSFLKLQSMGLHKIPGETGEAFFDDPTKQGNNRYLVQGFAPFTSQEGNLEWSQTPLIRCNVEALPKERKTFSQQSMVSLDYSLTVLQEQGAESTKAGAKRRDQRVYASIHPMPFPVIRLVFEQPRRIGLFYAVILNAGTQSGGLPRISRSFFLQQSLVLPSQGPSSIQEKQKIYVVDACVTIPPVVTGIQTVNLPEHLQHWREEIAGEGNLPRIPEGDMTTYFLQYFITEHGRGTLSGLISPGAQIGSGSQHYGYAQVLPNLDNQPLDLLHVSQGMINGVPLDWLRSREPRLFEGTIYAPLLNILRTSFLSRRQINDLVHATVRVQFDMRNESILATNTQITFQAASRTWQYTSFAWPKLEQESPSVVQSFLRNVKGSLFPVNYLPQPAHGSQTSLALPRGSGDVDGVPQPRLGNLARIVNYLSGSSTESDQTQMVTAWTKNDLIPESEAQQIVQQLSLPSASPLLKRYMALGAMIVQKNFFFSLRYKPLRLEGPNSTLYYAISAYAQQNDFMYLFLLVAFLLDETNFDQYCYTWPTLLVSQSVPWNKLYTNCIKKKIDISSAAISERDATPSTMGSTSQPPLAESSSVSSIDSSMVQGGFQLYRGKLEYFERVQKMKKSASQKRRSQEYQPGGQLGPKSKVSKTTHEEPSFFAPPKVSLGSSTTTPTSSSRLSSSPSQLSRFPSHSSSPLPKSSPSSPTTAASPSATRKISAFEQGKQTPSPTSTPLGRSPAPIASASFSLQFPSGSDKTFQFGQSSPQQGQRGEVSGPNISPSSLATSRSTQPALDQPFTFGQSLKTRESTTSLSQSTRSQPPQSQPTQSQPTLSQPPPSQPTPSQPTSSQPTPSQSKPSFTEQKGRRRAPMQPSRTPPDTASSPLGRGRTLGGSSSRYVPVQLPDNPRWPLD